MLASRLLTPPGAQGGAGALHAGVNANISDGVDLMIEGDAAAAMRLDSSGSLLVDVLSGEESKALRHVFAGRVTKRMGELAGARTVPGPGPGTAKGLSSGATLGAGSSPSNDVLSRVLRRGLRPEAQQQAAAIHILLVEPSAERQAYMMLAVRKVAT